MMKTFCLVNFLTKRKDTSHSSWWHVHEEPGGLHAQGAEGTHLDEGEPYQTLFSRAVHTIGSSQGQRILNKEIV
jgi:hypothetical protein